MVISHILMMLCSECNRDIYFGYLFRVRNLHNGYSEFCNHGWCFSCYKPWKQYIRSQKLKYICPLCRRHVIDIRSYRSKEVKKGGRLNPIRLD